MLITKNGTTEGLPHTSMVKQEGVWNYLLVCKVPLDASDEELTALFSTDTVEDDVIGVRWEYTKFVKITSDEANKYVWLTYTVQQIASQEYMDALNILGVETEGVEDEAV